MLIFIPICCLLIACGIHIFAIVLGSNVNVLLLYNKQDLSDIYDHSFLAKELHLDKHFIFQASAISGTNLTEKYKNETNCLPGYFERNKTWQKHWLEVLLKCHC